MKNKETLKEEDELVARCIKYPSCSSLNLNEDGTISVKVEKELSLDVIGETKLRVQVTANEEEWVSEDDLDDIDVNYLNK